MSEARSLFRAGLSENNAALVQMLGLCPLLAVTTTLVNGFVLGVATMAVLLATNVLISALRKLFDPVVRIPLFVLIIASFVTGVDLTINALWHDLHQVLGLFIPLIITNCAILAQAETVASRSTVPTSAASALGTGLGFLGVLVVLGGFRELFGQGSLLAGFDMLLGDAGAALRIDLPFDGMLAAVLPPGAFFGLALLLAARNAWRARRQASAIQAEAAEPSPDESSRDNSIAGKSSAGQT